MSSPSTGVPWLPAGQQPHPSCRPRQWQGFPGERWRQWGDPAIASPIITALVISMVSLGSVGFQALKSDIRDTETRLTAEITKVREEIKASEARLTTEITRVREDIRASEARQRDDLRTLNDKLDRVLAAP